MAWVTYKTGRRTHLPRVRGNFSEVRDGNWVVALYDIWLPGYYDTLETARRAAYLSDAVLSDLNARICHVDGEDRAIAMADIAQTSPVGTKGEYGGCGVPGRGKP